MLNRPKLTKTEIPKMAVVRQVPQKRYTVFAIVLFIIVILLATGTFMLGRNSAGSAQISEEQLNELKQEIEKLKKENERLSQEMQTARAALSLETAAKEPLQKQILTLEAEKSQLIEDLSFFESLLPVDASQKDVNIRRMVVTLFSPTQLNYRILLMQGGGKDKTEFNGNLELIVTASKGDEKITLNFPEKSQENKDSYKVSLKHYQRLEGTITLPENIIVKSVQARVMEKDQVRAQHISNL